MPNYQAKRPTLAYKLRRGHEVAVARRHKATKHQRTMRRRATR